MPEGNENKAGFINIQRWMVSDLGLKGNELLIYAIIFGFSQEDEHSFHGSLQYLADWCRASKQGVMKNLQSLCESGLIVKKEEYKNGIKFCHYSVDLSLIPLNKVYRGSKQSLTGGIKQSLPNNKDINNKADNKRDNIVIAQEGDFLGLENRGLVSRKTKRFTPPTVEEVQAYCLERKNGINAKRFVDYYESKGWLVGKTPMKDWRAAVRTWESNNKKDINSRLDTGNDDPILNAIFDGTYTG